MTGLSRVFDAAYPPAEPPPGCAGVLGYVGGQRATNVWTLEEWDRFAHLIQFPAYVPDPSENAQAAGIRASAAAKDLGWAPFQPDSRVIVCDLETLVERAWYALFAETVNTYGFTAVAYGSESTVFENAASDVWLAAWDGSPLLEPGQTIHAHQYQAGTSVDFSVADDWLMARGGIGPRHA